MMKRRGLIVFVVLLLCLQCCTWANAAPSMADSYSIGAFHDQLAVFCTRVDFRYGLVDTRGKVVVEPQWDGARWLTDDLIAVYTHDSGYFGIIGRDGSYRSNMQWDHISVGNLFFQLWKGDLFALMNRDGEQLTEAVWKSASDATDKICLVKDEKGKSAYVDLENGEIGSVRFQDARPFVNGLAAVKGTKGWGFVNKDGEPVGREDWTRVSDYQAGRAVCVDKKGMTCLQDEGGNVVLQETDYVVDEVNLTPYYDEVLGVYGYRDASGATAIAPRFREAKNFHFGLAQVKYRDAYGFVNEKGALLVPNNWTRVDAFVGRYAYVEDAQFEGYMDPEARLFTEYPKLQKTVENQDRLVMKVGDYSYLADSSMRILNQNGFLDIEATAEDVFVVSNPYDNAQKEDAVYGLISAEGKILAQPQWNSIGAFENGRAKVSLNGKVGLINWRGDVLCAPAYTWMDEAREGYRLVFTGTLDADGRPLAGKYGFLRADGALIVAPSFDYAQAFQDGLALVFTGKVDPDTGYPDTGAFTYLNGEGVPAFEKATWEQANPFSGGAAAVFAEGAWDIIDKTGASLMH